MLQLIYQSMMQKKIILILIGLVAIGGLSGCAVTNNSSSTTDNSVKGEQTVVVPTDSRWENLAKALTAAGAKMYGAYWCSHCQAQKAMFGSAWQSAPYVECSPNKNDPSVQSPACVTAGLQGYPTWIFADGTRVERVMSFDELAQKIDYQPST
ncbi:MAG: hypothetical protein WC553_00765 [Patescibacteria group bacterium]|jgi:thiol-disulfide isomerase/thioredoxin